MSKKDNIELLDNSVIQQLRSSLVISSLWQCVKELIHNAIDANATNIEVFVDTEKFCVQVNDNGYGIQSLHKLGQRHVTSKCHTLTDMNRITSFGYRGEALAAILNESIAQIISRHYQSNETYEGIWRDGKLVGEIGLSKYTQKSKPGTSVIARDLFYKYPVRRRKATTDYQHVTILETVKRLIINFALCFHYISFTFTDSARNSKVLAVKKTSNSLETFKQLFGLDTVKYLRTLAIQEKDITVEGFISTKSYPNKNRQFIYLNNCMVPSDNELYKIVNDEFAASDFMNTKESTEITPGRFIKRYPIYLIKFSCKGWNSYELHMYLELFAQLSSYDAIVDLMRNYVQKLLKKSGYHIITKQSKGKKRPRSENSTISYTKDPYLAHSSSSVVSHSNSTRTVSNLTSNISDFVPWCNSDNTMFYIDPKTGNSFLLDELPNKINRTHLLKKHNHSSPSDHKLNDGSSTSSMFKTQSLPKPMKLSKDDLLHVKVLGQADRKFIILKLRDIIVMVDQHAADERVKLEEMMRTISSVCTLEPYILIQVNSKEFQLLTSKQITHYFRAWGIHFVPKTVVSSSQSSRFFSTSETSPHFTSNNQTVLCVTQLPKQIVDRSIMNPEILKSIICDYLYWIMEQTDESIILKTCPAGLIEILKSRACRSAIMFNDELTVPQCEVLIQKLAKCNFPFQCAHGRPSAVPFHIEESSTLYNRPEKKTIHWNRFLDI